MPDLKILQIRTPASGSSTPVQSGGQEVLAKGPGGVSVVEHANLWRGQWGVNKGVNDMDWGTGGELLRFGLLGMKLTFSFVNEDHISMSKWQRSHLRRDTGKAR